MIIYDRQWHVPSDSNPEKHYTVSLKDGTYSCSCPAWTRHTPRRNCKHISRVIDGWYDEIPNRVPPEIVLANVEQVTIKGNEVLTPLIPIGDTWFQATLVYDLLRAGIPWTQIRERYDIAKANTKQAIEEYVFRRGRRVYKFYEVEGRHCSTYQVLPWGAQLPVMEANSEPT